MRVSVRETFAGQDCYRVDWITGPSAYQSEYWSVREDGIWVVGRKALGRELVFERPYLLLRRTPQAGDKWEATLTAGQRSENVEISVGPEEEIARGQQVPGDSRDAAGPPRCLPSVVRASRRPGARGAGPRAGRGRRTGEPEKPQASPEVRPGIVVGTRET